MIRVSPATAISSLFEAMRIQAEADGDIESYLDSWVWYPPVSLLLCEIGGARAAELIAHPPQYRTRVQIVRKRERMVSGVKVTKTVEVDKELHENIEAESMRLGGLSHSAVIRRILCAHYGLERGNGCERKRSSTRQR